MPSLSIYYKMFVVAPSINKKNLYVSLITSGEIINHQWMVQWIILKSCKEKWQPDKSIDLSDQSEMGEKNGEEKIQQNQQQFMN